MYFYWQICLWWRTSGFVPQFHWWVRPSKGRHLTPKPDLRLWTSASQVQQKLRTFEPKFGDRRTVHRGRNKELDLESRFLMADFFLSGPPKSGLEGLGQSTYLPIQCTPPLLECFIYIYPIRSKRIRWKSGHGRRRCYKPAYEVLTHPTADTSPSAGLKAGCQLE